MPKPTRRQEMTGLVLSFLLGLFCMLVAYAVGRSEGYRTKCRKVAEKNYNLGFTAGQQHDPSMDLNETTMLRAAQKTGGETFWGMFSGLLSRFRKAKKEPACNRPSIRVVWGGKY